MRVCVGDRFQKTESSPLSAELTHDSDFVIFFRCLFSVFTARVCSLQIWKKEHCISVNVSIAMPWRHGSRGGGPPLPTHQHLALVSRDNFLEKYIE